MRRDGGSDGQDGRSVIRSGEMTEDDMTNGVRTATQVGCGHPPLGNTTTPIDAWSSHDTDIETSHPSCTRTIVLLHRDS